MAVTLKGAAGTRGAAPAAYAIAGHVIVIALVGVSAAYAVRFGVTLVEWAPWIGGVLSVALEGWKATALVFIVSAWTGKQRVRACAGMIVLLAAICYSAYAVQFMASQDLGRKAGEASRLADQREALSAQLRAAEKDRDEAVERKAAAAIEAELAGLLARPGVNGCVAVDGKVTREVCPLVAALRSAKASAEKREKGEADAVRLAYQLSQLPATVRGAEDGHRIAQLVAVALELITLLGLWVVGPIVRTARVPVEAVRIEPVQAPVDRIDAVKKWLLSLPRDEDRVRFTQRTAAMAVALNPSALSRSLRTLAASGWLEIVGTGRQGTSVRLLSL